MVVTRRSALVAQRELVGHTQETLAGALSVDRSTVHRWESGKGDPRPWLRPRLAAELGVSVAQLHELLTTDQDGSAAPDPQGSAPDTARVAEPPAFEPSGGLFPSVAGGMRLTDSEALVADWASSFNSPATSLTDDRSWVTSDDVAVADDVLTMFRQLDHTHGAGPFAAQVTTYIDTELARLLARPAASDDTVRARARVATGFLELAGYQAVDSGDPTRAQIYYLRALAMTSATHNQAYGAYLVAANLGHLALHGRQPRSALRWAESAAAVASTAASPATRAAITAVQARAHARMGQEQESTALILHAEQLLDSSVPADEPSWIRYFTPAYLADEVAHCLHDLGRSPAARIHLSDAIEGVGRDKVRRLAIDAALLASTWLRTGDVDQACAAGRDAVDYAARTSSGRCVQRVAGVLAGLDAHADYAPVEQLREYARNVLPAADRAATAAARGA
ncbi:helix-turn-helix transcriptional regulator [Kitasatospora sp. NPDC052896]|uniref:helix-turn-helix transcriptional regulator n=1 Tax=Kitasatospora sp. NPDC052896 TaxID=3364061 RepID=UPI0037CAD9A2